ncbi:hypothetical protein ADUPG1_005974 [Aduncisulcus paluster]|uniref:Uncharacterized protein n=1 Tax=Aduncisulcus paluster TaxID=2918883 RepID=A0ABQ5KGB4_9EUKA|nr:hypothetical protein ADUPG1_005974 [Aduncisulcus paluster]
MSMNGMNPILSYSLEDSEDHRTLSTKRQCSVVSSLTELSLTSEGGNALENFSLTTICTPTTESFVIYDECSSLAQPEEFISEFGTRSRKRRHSPIYFKPIQPPRALFLGSSTNPFLDDAYGYDETTFGEELEDTVSSERDIFIRNRLEDDSSLVDTREKLSEQSLKLLIQEETPLAQSASISHDTGRIPGSLVYLL